MLDLDPKLVQALAGTLERVLVVDSSPASARLLTDLLHNVHTGEVWTATSTETGLGLAGTMDPRLIFTEFAGEGLDGLAFTRRLRRSDFLCRKAPVIMVTAQATPAAILGARDCGVHEFLRKPFTFKDLVRRLEAVTVRGRDWIEAVGYVGPDRRRFNSAEYKGTRRRRADAAGDPEQARVQQALRIIAAAVPAVESDRAQAFRALSAQADALLRSARALARPELAGPARELRRFLDSVGGAAGLTRAAVEPYAAGLLQFLPDAPAAEKAPAYLAI